MSIDFRVIDHDEHHFRVHANEPVTVEVWTDEDGDIQAFVYRGERGTDAPIGGYDGSSRNVDWIVNNGVRTDVPGEDFGIPFLAMIVTGNPVDGLQFWGPFTSEDEATVWANGSMPSAEEWWIARVYPPST